MNRTSTILLSAVCLLLLASPCVRAQTADEIVSKHISALGGKEKLMSLHSFYMEATAVMANGTEISTKTWKVKDKLYRQEISFGMGNVVIIVTPTKGWASSPRNGGEFKPIPDEQLKVLQGQMDPAGPFVDYAARGSKVELTGTDTVGGKECYMLKLTPASGADITYSIDKSTYYVLRESRKGGGMMGGGGGAGAGGGRRGNGDGTMNIDFSDYQKTPDGFIFPNTIVAGGFGAKSSVEKLEVNKPVDEAALSKPGN